jgi:hypothetical protein
MLRSPLPSALLSAALLLAVSEAQAQAPSPEAASPPAKSQEAKSYEEGRPPRPAPLSAASPGARPSVPWQAHVEPYLGLVYAARPAEPEGKDQGIRYASALGFEVAAYVPLSSWLGLIPYYAEADHELEVPKGALGLGAAVGHDDLYVYAFGLRVAPTWTLHPQVRAWLSAGVGWGRMEVGRMTLNTAEGAVVVRERSNPFLEFPLGLGADVELIPRWLKLRGELVVAPVSNQQSSAVQAAQVVDAQGELGRVGPMPALGLSWLPTLGLSLPL